MRIVPDPIVPGATYTVKCSCGFAHDYNVESGAEAMTRALEIHQHDKAELTFTVEPQRAAKQAALIAAVVAQENEAAQAEAEKEREAKLDAIATKVDDLAAKVDALKPVKETTP